MIITTLRETTDLGNMYGASHGAPAGSEMRFVPATTSPTTGGVRLRAVVVRANYVDSGIKHGGCVRTWSPPV